MKNNVIYRIILAGMLLGNPAVMMPMELNSNNQSTEQKDCPVCFDERPLHEFPVLGCGHSQTCVDCIRDQIELGLGEQWRELGTHFNCPARDCPYIMNENDIRTITHDENLVVAYSDIMLRLNTGGEGSDNFLRNCPTADCAGLYPVVPGEDRWTVRCEVCNYQYCSQCLRLHDLDQNGYEIRYCFCSQCHRQHNPRLQCPVASAGNNNNVVDEAEQQYQEWVRRNTKPCPRCNKAIEKNGGCNHMTCRRNAGGCGHEFCWVCLGNWALDRNHPSYYECRGLQNNNNNALNNNNADNDDPYFDYVPQPARRYESHHRNYTPIIVIGSVVIAAGATYGAYKLYKYFFPPKPAEEKDLKANLNDLHQEAIKSRARMNGAQGYAAGLLKDYFVAQEAKNAFKDLNAEKLTELKAIVDKLEFGLVAGNCDKQYAALVKFILDVDASTQEPARTKPVPQRPVLVKQQPRKSPKKGQAVRVQSTKNRRNKAKA